MTGPCRRRSLRGRGAVLALLGALLVAAAALPAPAAAAPWTGRTFPSSYDLRDRGRVSPIGKQDNHGTCWVFAAMGSLESNLLP